MLRLNGLQDSHLIQFGKESNIRERPLLSDVIDAKVFVEFRAWAVVDLATRIAGTVTEMELWKIQQLTTDILMAPPGHKLIQEPSPKHVLFVAGEGAKRKLDH